MLPRPAPAALSLLIRCSSSSSSSSSRLLRPPAASSCSPFLLRSTPSQSHHPQHPHRRRHFSSSSTPLPAVDPENYGQYCVELVKQHDFDSYLCGLLMPTTARRSFFALRAFNVETALVKDVARGNALPAQMRMQWWREVVAAIYKSPGRAPSHPVARAVAEAVETHGLTRRWLDRLLDARQRDLDNIQPMAMAEVEEYAENTASSLLYLTLESLNIRDATADHAASHVGKATGIVTLLRGTRYHASQECLYIPLELQREFKININDILKGPSSPEAAQALSDLFYEMASYAHLHLKHARDMLNGEAHRHGPGGDQFFPPTPPPPAGTVTALLPGVRTGMYLEALRESGFNALDENLLPKSHFSFQMKLWWANMQGKI